MFKTDNVYLIMFFVWFFFVKFVSLISLSK